MQWQSISNEVQEEQITWREARLGKNSKMDESEQIMLCDSDMQKLLNTCAEFSLKMKRKNKYNAKFVDVIFKV